MTGYGTIATQLCKLCRQPFAAHQMLSATALGSTVSSNIKRFQHNQQLAQNLCNYAVMSCYCGTRDVSDLCKILSAKPISVAAIRSSPCPKMHNKYNTEIVGNVLTESTRTFRIENSMCTTRIRCMRMLQSLMEVYLLQMRIWVVQFLVASLTREHST